jgi:putative flippase GtrA
MTIASGGSRGTMRRWLRFNVVGAIGLVVQLATLFLLKSILHCNYLAATGFAVEAAVINNFLWHERYTWADRVLPSWRKSPLRLLRFNLANGGISLAGNLALMKGLVGPAHMNYLAADSIAIVFCCLANFLVSDEWVFRVGNKKCREKLAVQLE